MLKDSIRQNFYSFLSHEEITCLNVYFEKYNLLRLNKEIVKLVEGKDLEVSDKTFYDICHFNDALHKANKTYSDKVFVGITEEAYNYYCKSKGKTVSHRTFSFGYTSLGDWKHYIEYTPKTAVERELLKGNVTKYLPIIFPKDRNFNVSAFNEYCVFLEEVEDGQEN